MSFGILMAVLCALAGAPRFRYTFREERWSDGISFGRARFGFFLVAGLCLLPASPPPCFWADWVALLMILNVWINLFYRPTDPSWAPPSGSSCLYALSALTVSAVSSCS